MTTPLQIVDPHIHLWDLWTRIYPHFEKPGKAAPMPRSAARYLLEEYLEEGGDEVEIVGAVHVEAFPTDPVKETETLQAVADRSPVPIVHRRHMATSPAPDFPALLDRHAALPDLPRHPPGREPPRQPRAQLHHPRPAWTSRTGSAGCANWAAAASASTCSSTRTRWRRRPARRRGAGHADHSQPRRHVGRPRSCRLEGLEGRACATLAAQPNIAVKISGLGMLDRKWTTESIRPLVLETLEAFGTERAMFASNFPVDKLYSRLPDRVARLCRHHQRFRRRGTRSPVPRQRPQFYRIAERQRTPEDIHHEDQQHRSLQDHQPDLPAASTTPARQRGQRAPAALDQGCRGRQPDVALPALQGAALELERQLPGGRLPRHRRRRLVGLRHHRLRPADASA